MSVSDFDFADSLFFFVIQSTVLELQYHILPACVSAQLYDTCNQQHCSVAVQMGCSIVVVPQMNETSSRGAFGHVRHSTVSSSSNRNATSKNMRVLFLWHTGAREGGLQNVAFVTYITVSQKAGLVEGGERSRAHMMVSGYSIVPPSPLILHDAEVSAHYRSCTMRVHVDEKGYVLLQQRRCDPRVPVLLY